MRDPLPGAVGVSKLSVYDTAAPDGLHGGTPHLHLCCTEAYVVAAGSGRVQTLSGQDGFQEHDLAPGTVLWFTPGTIHRLVNHGGLEITVLMANSGLPEAGDAVLTFPLDIVRDPDRYAEAAALPNGGAPGTDVTAAHRRRDLAVQGFHELRKNDGLDEFYAAATRLKEPLLGEWRRRWEQGAMSAAARTGGQLAALADGDPAHLRESRVSHKQGPDERGRLGMCGLLNTYRYD
ncbi:cupin domain-containing protein [Actinophytocola oryzae]|uniref:Cupin domain-containing protein n=1 Tax=Actinophytocola oryzae TaxID=502181 RepID=A0A4R7VS15_9PSEU|nr:cupin domain-containing protein [Actinophytocola oryzae]TDV52255.1 Cupin domain-containing protein [Actinophytocola oryzae]